MYKLDDKVWYYSEARGEHFPAVILECYTDREQIMFKVKYFTERSWHIVDDVDAEDLMTRAHVERVEEIGPTEPDQVNKPSHYTHGNIETIDVIEDWNLNFNLGNAIKYISR